MIALSPDIIPAELRKLDQWVCWRYVEREPGTKATKVPFNPRTGAHADTTAPATWSTFDEAVTAAPRYDGIGFVFTDTDPYFGVDLDGCRDPDTGDIEPWAQAIVDDVCSYTEVTPSGRGLHVIAIGKLPPGARRRGKVEMYDTGRFFTMTGRHVPSMPTAVEESDVDAVELHRRYLGGTEKPTPTAPRPVVPVDIHDHDLLGACR
jgi:putative DNA primase/helicase